MTCDDSCKSVLNKIFDSVNSGVSWTTAQIKSACPHKRKKEEEEPVAEDFSVIKPPYVSPREIHPSKKPCCFIKIQDPCRPCCCESKTKLPPCPPRGTQPPREPVCGCDLCQQNPGHAKCCDRSRDFRHITIDREYFEKA